LLRRALSLYGYFTGDIINAPRALGCLQEAVELAREMNDPVAEVSTVVNLGVVLTNIGWDDNAQRAFQLAWDVYERWPEACERLGARRERRVRAWVGCVWAVAACLRGDGRERTASGVDGCCGGG